MFTTIKNSRPIEGLSHNLDTFLSGNNEIDRLMSEISHYKLQDTTKMHSCITARSKGRSGN